MFSKGSNVPRRRTAYSSASSSASCDRTVEAVETFLLLFLGFFFFGAIGVPPCANARPSGPALAESLERVVCERVVDLAAHGSL